MMFIIEITEIVFDTEITKYGRRQGGFCGVHSKKFFFKQASKLSRFNPIIIYQ